MGEAVGNLNFGHWCAKGQFWLLARDPKSLGFPQETLHFPLITRGPRALYAFRLDDFSPLSRVQSGPYSPELIIRVLRRGLVRRAIDL